MDNTLTPSNTQGEISVAIPLTTMFTVIEFPYPCHQIHKRDLVYGSLEEIRALTKSMA